MIPSISRILTPILSASLVTSPLRTSTRFFSISSKMAQNQPHVLIVGGAYGGLSALNTLIALSSGKALPEARKGGPPGGRPQGGPPPPAFAPLPEISRALRTKPRYTVLDERDGFYHTVGAPLGTISSSFTKNMWVRYADIDPERFSEENVQFLQGSATGLYAEKKTLKYSTSETEEKSISYDYLVLGTGMRRGGPVVPQSTDKADALEEADRYEASLSKSEKIVLVGGGKLPFLHVRPTRTNKMNRSSRHRNVRRDQTPFPKKLSRLNSITRRTSQRRTTPSRIQS
jgi:hypothetical protein